MSIVSGAVQFDQLPVAKITHYPLELRDYKPYAQARICAEAHRLLIQMWAFEVSPEPGSCLEAVLCFADDAAGGQLHLRLYADRHAVLTCGGAEREATVHFFTGEDLQGIYWGATAYLPVDGLLADLPGFSLAEGCEFRGNFYKTCHGQRPHFGSFFEGPFADGNYLSHANWGIFKPVAY